MVGKNLAVYDAPKQTRSILLYWRLPEEWAEVLHEWVRTPPSDPISDVNTFSRLTPILHLPLPFHSGGLLCLCRRRQQGS